MTFYQFSIFCKIIKSMLSHSSWILRVPVTLAYTIIKLRNVSIPFFYQKTFLKYSSNKLQNHDNYLADIKWPHIYYVLGHNRCVQQKNHISFIFWKWKLVTIRRTYVWNGILKYSQLKSRYFVVLAIWLKESFFTLHTLQKRHQKMIK